MLSFSLAQIDPFGHSTFQAAMMSGPSAGFQAMFYARADYADIATRDNARTEEYIWAPSPTLGMNQATYGGLLYGGYCTIGGIDMDIGSNDQPINDNPDLEDYNVGDIVDNVVGRTMDQLKSRPQGNQNTTQDVIFPLGCDFNWEDAGTWYINTDKLVHWLNQVSLPTLRQRTRRATLRIASRIPTRSFS